ncbi:MAG: methionine biosynthesis protein MetW [Armatimonadia bacterium]
MANEAEILSEQLAGCPRQDFRYIIDLVARGTSVLDLGCGNGELLEALIREKQVRAQGLELSERCIQACVARGLTSIIHGDLDQGLADYADQSVDYVLLTNTIQVLHRPLLLIKEMARVGKQCVITLPNFAHWSARAQLLFGGRMPKTGRLPYEWYDTPNIHLTTIKDFRDFCQVADLRLVREIPLRTVGEGGCREVHFLSNLRADAAIFLVESALSLGHGLPA